MYEMMFILGGLLGVGRKSPRSVDHAIDTLTTGQKIKQRFSEKRVGWHALAVRRARRRARRRAERHNRHAAQRRLRTAA